MRVLLALDGSPHAEAAATLLSRLPWRTPPEVTLVTSVPASGGVAKPGCAEKAKEIVDKAAALLADHCSLQDPVIENKPPKELILQTAERINSDVIVLGASGHNFAHRLVLGSVSDYLTKNAKCSVLLARPMNEASAPGQPFSIVIACDGSEGSRVAYNQACDFAWQAENTHAHLTMILEKPKLLADDEVYDQPLIDESGKTLESLKLLKTLCTDVKQSVRECVHVGQGICSAAKQEEAQLLFIGGTSKSSIRRLMLGSTSAFVAHHAACSIWIAREKHWTTDE